MANIQNLDFSERKITLLGEKMAHILNLKPRRTPAGMPILYNTVYGPKTALGLGRAIMEVVLDAAVVTDDALANEVKDIIKK